MAPERARGRGVQTGALNRAKLSVATISAGIAVINCRLNTLKRLKMSQNQMDIFTFSMSLCRIACVPTVCGFNYD